MRYSWKHNIWTGNSTAFVSKSVRLVRIGCAEHGYMYVAEQWGDFSLNYPKSGNVSSTIAGALRSLPEA